MKDKTEKEWEDLKLRIFDLEDEMTTSSILVTELSRRLINIETTLATILADLYPQHFARCQYCKTVAEITLLEEHEGMCSKNPDNVYH